MLHRRRLEGPLRTGTFHSLRTRNYRVYASGILVSNVGTWMQRVAQDWLVLLLTSSGAMLGLTAGLQLLPALLLSAWAGSLADRWPRRRILLCTQVAMAAPSVLLGLLVVTGRAETWHVLVLAFIFGTATAIDAPARQSFASELVEPAQIGNAVSLNTASMHVARLVGPAVAGVAIAALGGGAEATGWIILANSLSYVAALLALWRIRTSELHLTVHRVARRRAVRDGLAYVRSRPDLQFLLTCALVIGTAGQAFQTLVPLMVTDVFGRGAPEFGLAMAVAALGSLIGALTVARAGHPRLRIIAAAGFTFGLWQAVAALMPTYATFVATLPFIGLSSLALVTAANATLQTTTTPHMRGRVVATFLTVVIGGAPLGSPALGWLAEETDPRIAVLAGAALTFVVMTVACLRYSRAIRSVADSPQASRSS